MQCVRWLGPVSPFVARQQAAAEGRVPGHLGTLLGLISGGSTKGAEPRAQGEAGEGGEPRAGGWRRPFSGTCLLTSLPCDQQEGKSGSLPGVLRLSVGFPKRPHPSVNSGELTSGWLRSCTSSFPQSVTRFVLPSLSRHDLSWGWSAQGAEVCG